VIEPLSFFRMRTTGILKTLLVLAGFLSGVAAFAQQTPYQETSAQNNATANSQSITPTRHFSDSRWLNSARDLRAPAREKVLKVGKKLRHTRLDCSHLVHELYQRAGLKYEYVNSEQLYDGMPGFRQVEEPVAGDIIVWRGHMGVIVDPLLHSFLSGLRTGVKISAYDSNYWKGRGIPRFFRYTADDDVVDLSSRVRVARNHIVRSPMAGE
jgi:cell wall-associated NlpC family hydrolase